MWGLIFPLSNLWPWPSMTFLRSPLPTLSLQGASQHIEATFDQKSIRKQFKLNFSWLPFSLFCIITESLDVFESTGKPIIFCKVLILSVCSAVEKNNGWGDVWHDHHGWHYGNSFADFWASTSIAAVLRLLHHAETMMLTFLLCHMLGVSSSCTNPVLYGFLNDNFVKAGANTEIHIQQFENPERILNPTKNTKVKIFLLEIVWNYSTHHNDLRMVLQEIHKLCGPILPCTTTEGGAGHNTNNQVRNFPPTFCFIFI